jgi:hypothetical protein
VVSSDALKNAPFVLKSSTETDQPHHDNTATTAFEFIPNGVYTKAYLAKKQSNTHQNNTMVNVVKIPKGIIGFVTVGTYTCSCNVEHMPLVRHRSSLWN